MTTRALAVGAGVSEEVSSMVPAKVYGVFQHTLVLLTEKHNLIAITTADERHYYTVNVNSLPSWEAGQEISLMNQHIGSISLLGIQPWSCSTADTPASYHAFSVGSIVNQIRTMSVNPGLMILFMDEAGVENQAQPLLVKARKGLDLLSEGAKTGSSGLCAQGAMHLAGLGPGLTPAGDDMISGLLGGLYWLKGNEVSSAGIRKCADTIVSVVAQRSNKYGAQGVRCASCGELTESAFAVLQAPSGTRRNIDRLARVGSTSGMDMLAGICAAIKILHSMQ